MKTISMMRRRADLTLAEFERHYETVHVPAGYKTYYFVKYVRNYVLNVVRGAFEYDAIVEFYPDIEHPAPPPSDETLQWFADDRAMFMDTKRAGGPVDEIVLMGPPRIADPELVSKLALMVRADADIDAFEAQLKAALSDDGEISRVTVDCFRDPGPPQPCGAIVWLWTGRPASEVLATLGELPDVVAIVEARTHETALEVLEAARA